MASAEKQLFLFRRIVQPRCQLLVTVPEELGRELICYLQYRSVNITLHGQCREAIISLPADRSGSMSRTCKFVTGSEELGRY